MTFVRKSLTLLALGLVTACSSTVQPAAQAPTATIEVRTETSLAAPAEAEGPVTPSMAQLQITGERFATLGDPKAPLTMVEFSDFG